MLRLLTGPVSNGMKNEEIANIFYKISNFLSTKDSGFRPFIYKRAADVLLSLEKDAGDIYKDGGVKALEKVHGIGKSLALKIEEFIKTGKIKYFEDLKKKLPINLEELISVEGLGPRKARILYQRLKIKNIKDLEKAAKTHKIASLFGFGEKTERNILDGISFLKRDKGRFLLGKIMPQVEEIYNELKNLKEVKNISIAGSLRRMKETIGDADILVSVNSLKGSALTNASADAITNFFVSMPNIVKIWAKGATKSSIRMKAGFDVDLRIVPEKSFGSALQYFTGSKEHNIFTRRIAMEKGLKLNEYGLFRGSKMIAGKNEENVYKAIGLPWIAPELRENEGEIEAALNGKLPKIIKLSDIKGDLHCHSNWDGGENSIEEMAKYAKELGYEYIGISDHTKFLRIENGLNEKQLLEQKEEIEEINKKFSAFVPSRFQRDGTSADKQVLSSKFQVLHGCEANIMPDGSIDIKDEVLAQLDYVIAGVHNALKQEKSKMTERIIRAMKNPNVDIISHPTGRLVGSRDEYQIDFDKILQTAKETGTILEINSSPYRLDLKDSYIRRAKNKAVKMIINTDSHQKEQLNLMKYGVAMACRGWAEKEDIVNTNSLGNLLKFFKK